MKRRRKVSGRSVQTWLLLASLVVLGIWLAFFDSHSMYRRVTWQRELTQLADENAALRAEIERLEVSVREAKTDGMVEKIAREQYGMRRPGERVYRVETLSP